MKHILLVSIVLALICAGSLYYLLEHINFKVLYQ
jgi:hypothetical protein